MRRYLSRSATLGGSSIGGSKLVLKKAGSVAPYDNAANPVTAGSRGVTLAQKPVGRDVRSVRPDCRLQSCGNTFVTGVEVDKFMTGVEPRSRVTAAAAQVKGSCRVAQRYQNVYKIYSRESYVYHCDFFRLMYFPPDHFLSLFRKSKPAINVRTVGRVFLNGNVGEASDGNGMSIFHRNSQKGGFVRTQDTHTPLNRLFENNPSNVPKNYAFLRRQLRLAVRKNFIREWCRLKGDLAVQETMAPGGRRFLDAAGRTRPGVAKDGYYMYQVLIFPDQSTMKEFNACVNESVGVVSRLDWDKFLKPHSSKAKGKTWVQLANDRVQPASLNRLLHDNEMPFAVVKS